MKYLVKRKIGKRHEKELSKFFIFSYPIRKNIIPKFKKMLSDIPNKIFILAIHNNKIVGSAILVKRKMNYCNLSLDVLGIWLMAIDKKYQVNEISKQIKKIIFRQSLKKDIILGFSRKKMDGYWGPYGFLGFTNFGEFKILLKDIKLSVKNIPNVSKIKKIDIQSIENIIKKNNIDIVGNLIRDNKIWNYYQKSGRKNIEFYKIIQNKIVIGYFFCIKNVVYEIHSYKNYEDFVLKSIKKFFLKNGYNEIIFHSSFNNSFILYLKKYPHTVTERFFWDGGHVIKIVSIIKFLNKIKKILQKRIHLSCINKFKINIMGVDFIYINNKLNIRKTSYFIEDENLKKEFAKILFGQIESKNPLIKSIFPRLYSQIPYIDQF